jgi:hypothetical protein
MGLFDGKKPQIKNSCQCLFLSYFYDRSALLEQLRKGELPKPVYCQSLFLNVFMAFPVGPFRKPVHYAHI